MAERNPPLLSPALMHKLDRVDVLSRKILLGKLQGERRSKKRGQSVEFADYRQYVVGDDLRRIDWNLYARLDKLFLRLFMEEEDLSVSLVVDVSASMDYGDPNKLRYAKQAAAALAYIGLVNYNRVSVFTFADTVRGRLMNLRGKRPVPQVLRWLEAQGAVPETPGDLREALKTVALVQRTPGLVVVISDFLDKGELADAVKYVARPRLDSYALQVLSPQEADPVKANLVGDLALVDVEDGHLANVSLTAPMIQRYRANLQAYVEHVRDTCARRDVVHLLTQTDVPVDELVLRYLRQRGIVG